MPINAHPEYLAAEREYQLAQSSEEKIEKLKKMISLAPGHKGAENLRAQLKTRLKKLLEQKEKSKKAQKGKKGIKKEDMQAVIIGLTNSGKSSLLSSLTNTPSEIAPYNFTTKHPQVRMMPFQGVNIQLIEVPALDSEYYDKGIVHTSDTIIIIVKNIEDILKIEKQLGISVKKIIVFNLFEHQGDERKISATLKSKKYDFVLLDLKKPSQSQLNELKEKIFHSFKKIRVFTKEPSQKTPSKKPIILNEGDKIRDVAEKILHGFSKKVKETFVTGPSSKFPNQRVGMKHILKDMDTVEFRTR